MAVGILLIGAAVLLARDKSTSFRFTNEEVGQVPAGWTADKTGKGAGSIWKVVADNTAPPKSGFALAQSADSASTMFNLCVSLDSKFKDGEIFVAFKANRGNNNKGSVIVWRYQDANNYYVARMNPLEDNYRV